MKAKSILLIGLLLAGSLMTDLLAQTHLQTLVKKCESMENVDMDIIRQRDPQTKEFYNSVVTVRIKDNAALMQEFLDAFKADENEAVNIVERKQNGKIVPSLYRFDKVSYTLSRRDDANGAVTVLGRGAPPANVDENGEIIIGG
jgi:predicted enzyme related to lactoylglutathione lyase